MQTIGARPLNDHSRQSRAPRSRFDRRITESHPLL